MEMDNS